MAETRSYHVVPISPLFTGTGNSLGPEEYYIDSHGQLVRFSTVNAIAAMDAAERRRLEVLMDGANVLDGVTLLRDVAQREPGKTTLYRIPVGASCRDRLASLNKYSDQAIQTMAHAGDRSDGVIPGTALKGAIRTAMLSEWLAADTRKQVRYQDDVWDSEGPRIRVDSRELEADVAGGSMDSDPFRYVTVRDITVATAQMRVDTFQMVGRDGEAKGGGERGKGVAMFGERVHSALDGKPIGAPLDAEYKGIPFRFPRAGKVEISIETEKRADPRVARLFSGAKTITFKQQAEACRAFYAGRLRAERARFPKLYEWWLDESLLDLFANSGILLRIGRHSHFESASLDGIRRGWNIQFKKPIAEGSSRTACTLASGALAPMGWVWLARA